jgi:hypothetical protein
VYVIMEARVKRSRIIAYRTGNILNMASETFNTLNPLGNIVSFEYKENKQTNSVALSPRANYTD